jgi:hypothetical protein
MTESLWTYYALVFCAQIGHYRSTFPADVRDQDLVLIIARDKSRLNLIAAVIFLLNGIDVLALPAHSSYFLQMFDVAVATPLKTAFKQELDRSIPDFARRGGGNRNNAQRLRSVLVKGFLNGFWKGATPGNIVAAGFEATGVFPFNPEVPLSS